MDKLEADEAHKAWVKRAYIDYYKVTDNIYRKEGSCNTYLIVTPGGSVVIDPAGASEPSSPLLSLTESAPLKAILLTHGHTDHNGGYEVWNPEKKTPVIAQREHVEFIRYHQRLAGFFAAQDAVQGNVATIKSDAEIAPTVLFGDEHSLELGGLHINIYHTPGETPDMATIWIPELKAAFVGDNYYTSFPNLSPPRGSKPRWALDFVNSLDRVLALEPEMVFPGHGEPIIGAEAVKKRLGGYRDAVLAVHDAVVKGMNEGKDVYTLMREIKLPADCGLDELYGKVSWGVRGIYEDYRGWYDGNVVNLYDQPVSSIYPDLLSLIGNDEAILQRAADFQANGEEAKSLRLCDVVLEVKPDNQLALGIKLRALMLLRKKCSNFIEARQLDNAIRVTRERIAAQ
jgi:alkyl sulfatase BDS1-like metallo-beta-lactamase superfamily hydrolase